jgi:hypothetical protein
MLQSCRANDDDDDDDDGYPTQGNDEVAYMVGGTLLLIFSGN